MRWQKALGRIDEFLAWPCRRTLPAGRFEPTQRGMSFTSAGESTWSIEACASTWGDLVVATGFRAQ